MSRQVPEVEVGFDWAGLTEDLVQYCIDHNVTQKRMAEEIGLAPATVNRVLQNFPVTAETAAAICLYLGRTMDDYVQQRTMRYIHKTDDIFQLLKQSGLKVVKRYGTFAEVEYLDGERFRVQVTRMRGGGL